jgi:hypothetical protein
MNCHARRACNIKVIRRTSIHVYSYITQTRCTELWPVIISASLFKKDRIGIRLRWQATAILFVGLHARLWPQLHESVHLSGRQITRA